jgi:hypothetical protein
VFRDEAGASAWGLDPEITCRPATFVAIRAGLHVEKVNEDTQWVENVAGLRAFMPRSHGVNRQPGVCGTLRSGRGKWRQETV